MESFDGYGGSTGAVYRQAWAVWQALAVRGIRYSAADPGIARGPRVFSQRVRLLEQTWADRSANCVDGSVLIASVLQRIGLRSFLVLVPGHAFVGFYTDAEATHAAYLETTLLGAPSPQIGELPGFADAFDGATARRLDIAGFAAALEAGRRRHARTLRGSTTGIARLCSDRHRRGTRLRCRADPGVAECRVGRRRQLPLKRTQNRAPPSAAERDTTSSP